LAVLRRHAGHRGDDLDREWPGEVLYDVEVVGIGLAQVLLDNFRGVNALLSRLRIWRCSGGSMKMMDRSSEDRPLRTIARSQPREDEKVSKSFNAAATSTWRVSA
jgi:hypothetical protein